MLARLLERNAYAGNSPAVPGRRRARHARLGPAPRRGRFPAYCIAFVIASEEEAFGLALQ
ncbi:hypothetical protein AFCDBAGC_4046 [Methylobacterium cerastii]|uniref:Uncharacterized protein n=1 Tax=Methylobacterium cerastii TaxID=932741 RepID=A0ABQ4QM94_9HYPH|nr:hypothetical protein AFCDBAGC_4046 [Methylobacterium cerastii]